MGRISHRIAIVFIGQLFFGTSIVLAANEQCLQTPEHMPVSGASFDGVVNLGIYNNKEFNLVINSNSLEKKEKERSDQWQKQYDAWLAANKSPGRRNTDEYREWSSRERDITRQLDQQHPFVESQQASIKFKLDNTACIQFEVHGECKDSGTKLLSENGKPYGLLEIKDGVAFLFSVRSNGTKDPNRPYLKLTKDAGPNVRIAALTSTGEVGGITSPIRQDDTATNTYQSGTLDLVGHQYLPANGSNCIAGFVEVDQKKQGDNRAPWIAGATMSGF